MFSAFHFHANRNNDKRFKQLYKSSEKRIDSNNKDKETEVEQNLNRSRNSRYMLVEKFRQAQGLSANGDGVARLDETLQEESGEIDEQVNEEEDVDSFGRLRRRHSGSSYDETKFGYSRRDKQSEEGPGFDYSSSYNSSFSEVLSFNLSRDCNESELFNNKIYGISGDKRDSDRPLTFAAATRQSESCSTWTGGKRASSTSTASSSSSSSMLPHSAIQSTSKALNWNFDDDEHLLCPECRHNYMRVNSSALVCYNCTFEHKLRSNFFGIKEIKNAIQDFLRKHGFGCDHQVGYAAKGNEMRVYCNHCSKYISI